MAARSTARGPLPVTGGLLNFTGGATVGDVGVYNGQLSIASTVTQVSTVGAFGGSTVFVDNLSPFVTVWVEGRSSFGDAILNLSANVYQSRDDPAAVEQQQLPVEHRHRLLHPDQPRHDHLGGSAPAATGSSAARSTTRARSPAATTTSRSPARTWRRAARRPGRPSCLIAPVGDRLAGLALDDRRHQPRRHAGDRQPGRLHPLGQRQRPVQHRRRPQAGGERLQPGDDPAAVEQQQLPVEHRHRLVHPDQPRHHRPRRSAPAATGSSAARSTTRGRSTAATTTWRSPARTWRRAATTAGQAELFNCTLFETASPASASTIVATSIGDTLADRQPGRLHDLGQRQRPVQHRRHPQAWGQRHQPRDDPAAVEQQQLPVEHRHRLLHADQPRHYQFLCGLRRQSHRWGPDYQRRHHQLRRQHHPRQHRGQPHQHRPHEHRRRHLDRRPASRSPTTLAAW